MAVNRDPSLLGDWLIFTRFRDFDRVHSEISENEILAAAIDFLKIFKLFQKESQFSAAQWGSLHFKFNELQKEFFFFIQ